MNTIHMRRSFVVLPMSQKSARFCKGEKILAFDRNSIMFGILLMNGSDNQVVTLEGLLEQDFIELVVVSKSR